MKSKGGKMKKLAEQEEVRWIRSKPQGAQRPQPLDPHQQQDATANQEAVGWSGPGRTPKKRKP